MNNERSFQKLAGLAAVLSAPLAILSLVLVIAPVQFNFEAFQKTELFFTSGPAGARTLHWAMIADIFGFYLLLAPAALFLLIWLKPKGEARVGFYTFCGLAYIALGAAGAAVLSAVWPSLINAHAQASGEQAYILEALFAAFTGAIADGVWNTLNTITAGIWLVGIGSLLRSERGGLGIFTIIAGLVSLLDGIGTITGTMVLASLGQTLYFVLMPVWALWLGIDLVRKPIN